MPSTVATGSGSGTLDAANDALRSANAAVAERERATALRAALVPDLTEAEREIEKLATSLAGEQRDVLRYERGVWAFLYDIFADREARLTKEQREAAEVETRYREAVALRDRLTEELGLLDARLAALVGADAELAAAQVGKQVLLVARGGPEAEEFEAIGKARGEVDAEAKALDEALAAGGAARSALARLAEVLGSARNWGVADMVTDSFLISWAKRNRLDDARSLAGAAQAELTVFQRELADVGLQLHAEMANLSDHHRFLDTWFDNIFSDLSVQSRIEQAQATTTGAIEEVDARLGELQSRRAKLDDRIAELSAKRLRLLAPTPAGS